MLTGGAGRPPRDGGGGPFGALLGLGLSLFEADDKRLGGGGLKAAFCTLLFCVDVCGLGNRWPGFPFCNG